MSTVLIVDDDYYINKDVLGLYFSMEGYTVISAFSVKEFEAKWQLADIIILDIRLPEEEGLQISPWGGLDGLRRIRDSLVARNQAIPPQLKKCIIRSAQTKSDAVGAGVNIPEYSAWFAPDVPISQLVAAVEAVAKGVAGDQRR